MRTIVTALNIEDAMMHTQGFANRKQWILAHKDEKSITFTKQTKPHVLGFLLLLFVFVLPAFLYLIFGWKKESIAVYFTRTDGKTNIALDAGGNSFCIGRALVKHLMAFDTTVEMLPSTEKALSDVRLFIYVVAFIIALVFVGVFVSSVSAMEKVQVSSVVDGDTLKIQIGAEIETVRLLGIDTPETVHPEKLVQCFGREASAKMVNFVEGRTVTLERNPAENRDMYGRLLRYVHVNGEDISAAMIREGYAFSYKQFPHPRLEKYNTLEREARDARRGLWADGACGYAVEEEGRNGALFSDVPASHAYYPAIAWGKATGVLSGYPDGSFQPERSVNRAEFLKIVLGTAGVETASAGSPAGFPDVDEAAWYAPFIRYAKAQGIVKGYPDSTFRPEQAVNAAEALKMAYEALGVRTEEAGGAWYERYLRHARGNGVLFTEAISMDSGMSRQDVVWIVWRLAPEKQALPASPQEAGECRIKGNISSNGKEKIYHRPDCGSYDRTVIDPAAGERWFCSEEEAIHAGWRKAGNCP